MDVGAGPTWLGETCPAWCTREHREDDHPEDRRHQSTARIIAVDVPTAAIPGETTQAVEVAVYLDQPVAQPVRWLRVESVDSDQVRLTVATTSADDLLDALASQISRLDAETGDRRR
jgi:hypothetical protein